MSSNLSDQVDRLTQLATSIRSTATSFNAGTPTNTAGLFTRAILSTPLGDLIRDIDSSELGLFTLVTPPQPGAASAQVHENEGEAGGSSVGEIVRVGFAGATPLKRPVVGRDGTQRMREHEPEVYAYAALKYLDKYHSIRPMPRAVEQVERILEELTTVRESIDALNESLLQNDTAPSEPSLDPKAMAKAEEQRIQELQAEIAELRRQKEFRLKKKTGIRSAAALTPKRRTPTSKLKSASLLSPSSPDAAEHSFWNTPAAAARTLHFSDDSLLTDEHMDLSAPSLASPLMASESKPPLRAKPPPVTAARQLSFELSPRDDWKTREAVEETGFDDSFEHIGAPVDDTIQQDDADDDDDEDDKTVMFKKPLPPVNAEVTFELPSPPPAPSVAHVQPNPKKQKYKITEEMEGVVLKIWMTMGEVVMPANPFDLTGSGIGVKPPRAKETLAHLQQLSLQITSPGSPTTSVSSATSATQSQPAATTQQILIAHVLLALLAAPPSYSMSLNKLKENLAEKNGGVTAQAVTRPIYSCVAKRLLKIERGGGEQVVRFDI